MNDSESLEPRLLCGHPRGPHSEGRPVLIPGGCDAAETRALARSQPEIVAGAAAASGAVDRALATGGRTSCGGVRTRGTNVRGARTRRFGPCAGGVLAPARMAQQRGIRGGGACGAGRVGACSFLTISEAVMETVAPLCTSMPKAVFSAT